MQWQDLENFLEDISCTKAQIAQLVKSGELEVKNENGQLYLRHGEDLTTLNSKTSLESKRDSMVLMQGVLQKVLDIHFKFAFAKDEMIASLKSENEFLKSTILSMQEVYMQDKKCLIFYEKKYKKVKRLEAMKKKYEPMWDEVREVSDR